MKGIVYNKWIASLAIVGLLTMLLTTIGAAGAENTFSDDFSTDTGMWTYVGNAYRDKINEYVVLTQNINGPAGVIWLNKSISSPFTVEFKYKAGGGTGADGLVFMFYKKKDYTPDGGGRLGFTDSGNSVPGYGIEFDNYYNPEFNDPSANHIALIKDHVNNHLIYVDDNRTEDNKWHDVKVRVENSMINVSVDNGTVFTWNGTINRTYDGFGFSAATGGYNNWHIIDDVKIKYSALLTVSTDKLNYSLGETINLTIEVNRSEAYPQVAKFRLQLKEPYDTPDTLIETQAFMMPPVFYKNVSLDFKIPETPFIPSGQYSYIATLIDPNYNTTIATDSAFFTIDDKITTTALEILV